MGEIYIKIMQHCKRVNVIMMKEKGARQKLNQGPGLRAASRTQIENESHELGTEEMKNQFRSCLCIRASMLMSDCIFA